MSWLSNAKQYHVEDDLQLRTLQGIDVCDLSFFLFSPEVNPNLTLVALVLLSQLLDMP